MAAVESKPTSRAIWALAYALAAALLLAAVALAWLGENDRPWQEEIAAINARRGQRLERRLLAMGAPPQMARQRGQALADEPPRVIETRPHVSGRPERCLSCHRGIEQISPSHPVEAVGCVACHGGNGLGLTKQSAHQGLRGRNPSDLGQARASCGQTMAGAACHEGRQEPAANAVTRVERTIMSTMTGVLTSLRVSWGAQGDFTASLATADVSDPEAPGQSDGQTVAVLRKIDAADPASLDFAGLANDHWRKFCARCHLRASRPDGQSVHGAGCAACHGMRHASGRYLGADAAIADDEPGHAAYHRLLPTPPEENCRRCHNRSGRIGLNYRGWMEDESGRVPWPDGQPRQHLGGGRALRSLLPDIHAEKGLSCIDCHTSREIMGDGRIYQRMRFQTEIRCQTCHGGPGRPPQTGPADGAAAFELRHGPLKDAPTPTGDDFVLGVKGRPLSNARLIGDKVLLRSKTNPGQTHQAAIIAADPRHNLPGHQRLSCQACHSRWTPQCFGCHDLRGQGGQMWDFAADGPRPGVWSERRDVYRFLEPILGVDSRGQITPFTPGCQVSLSVLDQNGQPLPGQWMTRQKGGPAGGTVVSTPLAPHTTRLEVRPCQACHQNPRALGLGDGPMPLDGAGPESLDAPAQSGLNHGWAALTTVDGRPLQDQTHQGARPLNAAEIGRTLAFGRCLPCHFKPHDPVLQDPAKARQRIGPGGDLAAKHRLAEEKALR